MENVSYLTADEQSLASSMNIESLDHYRSNTPKGNRLTNRQWAVEEIRHFDGRNVEKIVGKRPDREKEKGIFGFFEVDFSSSFQLFFNGFFSSFRAEKEE